MKGLEGKKTYIAAGLLLILGIWGFWSDELANPIAFGILVVGFGMFGLGDKAERFGQATMDALAQLKAEVKRHPGAGMTVPELKEFAKKVLPEDQVAKLFQTGEHDISKG